MATQYEIDHNIKLDESMRCRSRRSRRPSMSSFFAQLSQIETSPSHNNPHATPTPVDMAAAERQLQEQLGHFLLTASSDQQESFLQSLISSLEHDIDQPPTTVPGVPQEYLDQLERVSRKNLKKGDECKICGEEFLEDEFCLVVQLPCHPKHRFDLDCVGPWLRLQGTCPVDRKDLIGERKHRIIELTKVVPDEEEYDDMFA
ncbi:unnamed protein product [Blumeria hordei]|uniref:RING-type domain-containing protein n=1 Tax=Blumeria hordei TaxID=2867405 RepID=A0A383UIG7_BLUHO|nr:unnamed protein product [Blumeria hordei]